MHASLLVFIASAEAATLTVSSSGPYTSIDAAIAAAAPGDVVEVAPGTWYGAFSFGGKGITVRSTHGAAVTVIDGQGASAAVLLTSGEGPDAVLEGFTVVNAGRLGVQVSSASPTLRNVTFTGLGNVNGYGGALSLASTEALLEDCTFSGNVAQWGAHAVVTGGAVTMRRTTFEAGSSTYGGLFVTGGASLTVEEGSFTDNTSIAGGGAIYADGASTVTLVDPEMLRNQSPTGHGGALAIVSGAHLDLHGGAFSENVADPDWAVGYYGGSLFVGYGASAELTGTRFEDGEAYYGGAVGVYQSSLTTTDVTYHRNDGYLGGAVFANEDTVLTETRPVYEYNEGYAGAGGLYLAQRSAWVATDPDASSNVSTYGSAGALFAEYGSTVDVTGGSFKFNNAYYHGGAVYGQWDLRQVDFHGTTFQANTATYGVGGAWYLFDRMDATCTDCVFADNRAASSGGAIYAATNTTLTLTRTVAERNESVAGWGGAVYHAPVVSDPRGLWLHECEFRDNVAWLGGGAALCVLCQPLEVLDSVFVGNRVEDPGPGGAVAQLDGRGARIERSLFLANDAEYGGAVYFDPTQEPWPLVRASGFADNRAAWGGDLAMLGGEIDVENASFAASSVTFRGASLYLFGTSARLVNVAVAHTSGAPAIDADGSTLDATYSTLAENLDGDLTGLDASAWAKGVGNLTEAPGFVDAKAGNLVLWRDSPLIDAGDPNLLDLDGTRSDVGMYGGDGVVALDEDGDGWDASVDCDDAAADAFPGAMNTWYDGFRQDCASGSDFDADGDGHDAEAHGGDDCDDADPTRAELCEDPTGTTSTTATPPGTAGDTGQPSGEPGCGCGGGAPPTTPPWWLAPLALTPLRRRRR